MFPNYEYAETVNEQTVAKGEGWGYWSDRVTPDECCCSAQNRRRRLQRFTTRGLIYGPFPIR